MLRKLAPTRIDLQNMLRFESDEDIAYQFDSDSDNFNQYHFQQPRLKQKRVRKEKFDVDAAMNNAYERNKDKIVNESIRQIGNDIFAYYNSLNILVGQQGKGKTHILLRDIIQISRLQDCNFHLIVYISKSGTINDSTFESQQELIQLPIQCVSDKDADKYLKQLDLYKDLFAKYCKDRNSVNSELVSKMFDFLHVDEVSESGVLNTIIIAEDFVKSALLKSAYFTNYITQLRHKHAIVYINVQFFKAIPTDYKNNCSTFIIFSGFSRQKLNYIYQQVPMPIEFEELWYNYSQLKGHDVIIINTRVNEIKIKKFD